MCSKSSIFFYSKECPTPPNPRVVKANSSIWSNEGIYQVPIEVEPKFFPTSATSELNHQFPIISSTNSRRTRQRETGQKRQRHVSAMATSDKRANNPSAVASTASEASSGFADADLWQQQNKFHAKDFEQDHPFQENLVGIRSNSGNYKRLASQPQPPQPQAGGRPSSQHIYVDMDSSTSSFSSVSGAVDRPETPSSGANAQCHTPRSFVVSQC